MAYFKIGVNLKFLVCYKEFNKKYASSKRIRMHFNVFNVRSEMTFFGLFFNRNGIGSVEFDLS